MDYPQAAVSIIMLVIFIMVGLPLWWNTTKVYRADIPSESISKLMRSQLKLKIIIEFYGDVLTEFDIKLFNDVLQNYQNDVLRFELHHRETPLDEILGQSYCSKLKEMVQTDLLVYKIFSRINLDFSEIKISSCNNSTNIIFNLPNDFKSENLNFSYGKLVKTLFPSKDFQVEERSRSEVLSKMPPSLGYRLNFVLAVANPTEFIPRWDIETAIESYIQPYLEKYAFLGPFLKSSQILYYFDPKVSPTFKDGKHYYMKSKLSLLINPLESRLNTYITTNNSLNFVIYVPDKKNMPLYVKRKTKEKDYYTKTFHSPRWGGVAFYNTDDDNATANMPLENIMNIFIHQFNELVGIDIKSFINLFPNQKLANFNQFLVIKLKIEKTVEYIKTSLSTLSSLVKLLDEIGNIVIRDDIAQLIKESVKSIKEACENLKTGNLGIAYEQSRRAFELSEKAFYDSSLLALLYFPEDQKYAIYVPLFLPISIPVILSFFKAVKWLRSSEMNDSKLKGE